MSTDYAALNRMCRKHKGALTRAKNSDDPHKVIAACEAARDDFNAGMWPDNWPLWNIAYCDAQAELYGFANVTELTNW